MKTFDTFINESQEVLNKISKSWERKHPGMRFSIYQSSVNPTNIQLHSIKVPKDKRNQGIGSRAIKGLINYAKRNKQTVSLTPQAEKNKKAALERFYKRAGFKKNKNNPEISDTRIFNA